MPLLFKHGALSTQQQNWAQSALDKYPYSVLLNSHLDYDWSKQNLLEHIIHEISCFGVPYTRKSQMHMSFACSVGMLYFFCDKRDYDKVCELKNIVVDSNPFMTILK